MSGRAPLSKIDPWLAGLLALEFIGIAGVTILLILMRSAPEVVALYGMLMLAAAALPVWLIAPRDAPSDEDGPDAPSPASRHTSTNTSA